MKKVIIISLAFCAILSCIILSCQKHKEGEEATPINSTISAKVEEEDSLSNFLKEDTIYSFTSLVFDERVNNKIVTIELRRNSDTVFVKRIEDTSSFVHYQSEGKTYGIYAMMSFAAALFCIYMVFASKKKQGEE